MSLCRLCLNHGDKLIDIFSEHGRSLNISATIAEYFLFEIYENDAISTTICQKCWFKTADFQQFHASIKIAQEGFFKNSNFLEYDHKEFGSQLIDASAASLHSSSVVNIEPFECMNTVVAKTEILVEDAQCKLESDRYSDGGDDNDAGDRDSDYDYEQDTDYAEKKLQSKKRSPSKRNLKCKPEESSSEEDSVEENEEEEEEPNEEYDDDECDYGEYNTKTTSSRSNKRASQKKREEDDARIRSVCSIFCTICSAFFHTFNEVARHYQVEHDMKGFVMCCDRKITARSRLLEHIECHINPNAFQCEICKSTFSGRFPLKKHMDTHKTDDQKPFICEKCPNRYTKAILLARHTFESHSPEEDKKFACELCDKKFLTKGKLADHNKRSHNCVPEICDFCGKVFKSIYNLNVHRTEVHMGHEAPKMQCSVCGTWLKEKYLKKHLKRHNAGLEKCTVCGKVLQNKNSLGNHMRNVHGNRMHQCAVCGKTFSKPLSLREHMALHTGQDLYTCPYCPKTFKSGANMHSHRKKIHFDDWEKDRGKRLVTGNFS